MEAAAETNQVVSRSVLSGDSLGERWRRRCRSTPGSVFLISEERELTYAEADRMADLAISILDQCHVRRGDVVGLQMETNLTYVIMLIACFKAELLTMPLSPRLNPDEACYLVEQMKPSLLVMDHDQGPLAMACRDGAHNYSGGKVQLNQRTLFIQRRLSLSASPAESGYDSLSAANRPAAILCTSGTTSYTKGCLLSNKNILASEISFNQIYEITDKDRLILASGFYHAIGFHHGIVSTFLAGGSMVLLGRYSSQAMMELTRRYCCTYTVTVPTVVYDLLAWYRPGDPLKRVISGGAPLSQDMLGMAWKSGLPLYNIYGLTECAPFSCTTPAYYRAHEGMTTAGFPICGTKIRLVDKTGRQVREWGRSGQILVQGPTVFQGYYRNPKETHKVLTSDGWFSTGDQGHMTPDGALVMDDRLKDMVIRGGENISTGLVESYLLGHPDIAEAAVVGVDDPRLGERIGAFIVMKTGKRPLELEQVKEYLASRGVIKKFWPEVLKVRKSLPRTSSGKIKKYLLS